MKIAAKQANFQDGNQIKPRLVSDHFLENGLPSNLEAERTILGAILLDNTVCNQAIELVRRDDFFLESHRRIFDKMMALSERGEVIDLITLGEELRRSCELVQVGGAPYLSSLIDGVPRAGNIEPYAKIVKEAHLNRAIITLLNKKIADVFDGEDEADRIIQDLENELSGLSLRLNTASQKKNLYTVEELKELKPADWLIPSLLARGAFTLLYGPSGAFKSFFTLDQMLFLSSEYSIVYVAAEGQTGLSNRIEAWQRHHKISPGKIFFWIEAVDLLSKSETTRFIRAIEKTKPDVVVFDTLSRCMPGGNENAPEVMGAFIHSCGRVQSELNAAVWVNHHPRKGSTVERGHTSLRAAADVMVEISNDDGLVTIHCDKAKDEEPFENFYLRPVKITLFEDESSLVLLPANRVLESEKLSGQKRKLLETLNLEIFRDTGAKVAQLNKDTSIAESTIYRLLSRLMEKDFVYQGNKGEPFFITEKGRDVLNSQSLSRDSQNIIENSD